MYDKQVKVLSELAEDSITIQLNQIAQDMADFIDEHSCDSFESQDNCLNPNCSWFNHSMVGMRGGDLPEGYNDN